MTIALWVLQGLLAAAFLFHGLLLAGVLPKPKALEEASQNSPYPESFMRFIGWAEVLAALGLLLPALTGTSTWLTPLAALGLTVIMVGAVFTHLRQREAPQAAFTLVLTVLVAFVAYGRWVLVPFA